LATIPGDDLGRILKVGVDQDNGVTFGVVEAGGNRDLVAEIARQADNAGVFARVLDVLEQGRCRVLASVVHIDDLERHSHAGQNGHETFVRMGDDFLLVIAGYDHGQLGAGPDAREGSPATASMKMHPGSCRHSPDAHSWSCAVAFLGNALRFSITHHCEGRKHA
jgi:hypothetical protein